MRLRGEKDSGKNNENSAVIILNIDTKLRKYSKIKFLTLLRSKFRPIMYIRLSY